MQNKLHSVNFKALGTDIGLDIVTDCSKEEMKKNFEEIKQLYFDFEKKLSRFDQDSELSHLNKNLHFSHEASRDILELSSRCLHHFTETDGLFDSRVIEDLELIGYRNDFRKEIPAASSQQKDCKYVYGRDLTSDISIDKKAGIITFHARMDFGGIAKGYFTDKISEFILEKGFHDFIVDSGGDMYVSGKNVQGEKWKISIEGVDEERIILLVENKAVATSGISRRKWECGGKKYHHLINPKSNRQFSHEIKTVTVIADSVEDADVLAKTLFLLGKERGLKKAEEEKIPCAFLMYSGTVFYSSHLKNFLFKNL